MKKTETTPSTAAAEIIRLEDYIHFYIGNQILCENDVYTLVGLAPSEMPEHNGRLIVVASNEVLKNQEFFLEDCKLLLRLTIDTDVAEDTNLIKVAAKMSEAQRVKFFIDNGFDMFGLIDAGVAIDKAQKRTTNDPFNLTKDQAIAALNAGKKVHHRYFMKGDYIFLEEGVITAEDGHKHVEYWAFRTHKDWNTNWGIFNEQK